MSIGKVKKIHRVPPQPGATYGQLFGLVIRALPGLNLSGRIRCRVILRTIVRFVIPGRIPIPAAVDDPEPEPEQFIGLISPATPNPDDPGSNDPDFKWCYFSPVQHPEQV